MTNKMKSFYRGDEITKIKVMKKLRTPIIHLLGTYPLYYSWGIIEHYFDDFKDKVVDELNKEGFIEIKSKTQPRQYRLTPKGVDLAISFINLKYSEETHGFNKRIIILTTGLFCIGLAQFILIYLQNPFF